MKMRAVVVEEPGGPEKLVVKSIDRPKPGRKELLVKVHATAVNRADISQRQGKYAPPPGAPETLGLEFSGVVEETGPGCTERKIGERIFGLVAGGAYAEYLVAHEDLTLEVPENLDLTDAAAVPEAFLTAYQALYWHAELVSGERILIHAAASGVGTAVLQLARELGAETFTTCSAEKVELLRRLGANNVLTRDEAPFAEKIRERTAGAGVQVIIDFVLGDYFADNLAALSMDGRLLCLGWLGGTRAEHIDLRAIVMKRAKIIGSTLRNRGVTYQRELVNGFARDVVPKLSGGWVVPVVDRVLKLADVAEAHRYIESNRSTGKVVLTIA